MQRLPRQLIRLDNKSKLNEENVRQLIPTIYTNKNVRIPILFWKEIEDKTIRGAVQEQKSLCYKSIFGLNSTPYGHVPWLLMTFYLREQLEDSQPIYWLSLCISPRDLTKSLAEWHTLLQSQTVLFIIINRGNSFLNFPLLTQPQLAKFVSVLDCAVSLWKDGDNFQQAASYQYPQLVRQKESLEQFIRSEDDSSQGHEVLLLRSVTRTAIAHLKPEDPLYQAALKNELSVLKAYLQRWAKQIPLQSLNSFLATPGFDTAENICRDWLFAHECIEQSRQLSKHLIYIAMGISDIGSWCLRSLPNHRLYGDEILSYAKTYRYLLRQRWTNLLTSNDMIIGLADLLKLYNLGIVPQRKQFDEVTRILQIAALEKQFSIAGHTIIEIGKDGCQEIEFLPIQGDFQCLFKVTLSKQDQGNLCLLGELDALKGSIAFAGPPPDQSVQGHLRLLLFLVTLAYRDLLVAAERIGRVCPSSNSASKHRNQGRKTNKFNQVPNRLIPRFKNQIDKKFAEPSQFIRQLHKISPHIRVAHVRQLPESHKASEKQKQLAQEYGWILPEGYTFVKITQVNVLEVADFNDVKIRFRSLSLLEIFFSDC